MAKKPSHEQPEPDDDRPQPPHRPDHDLPPHPRPKGPHPEHEAPDAPDPSDNAPSMVGRVQFEDVSGGDNGAATYAVPPALRERVLVWRHKQHEQSYVNDQGHWVYRQTHTAAAGALERDADLEPIETPDA